MPDSTWPRARAAPSIQSKVRPEARRSSSAARSMLRIRDGRAGDAEEQVFKQAAEGAQQA